MTGHHQASDPEDPSRPRGVSDADLRERAWKTAVNVRAKATNASLSSRRWVMACAVVVFVVAAVLAIVNFPETDEPISWPLILIGAVVGAPLAVLLNALEYRCTARSVGREVDVMPALRVTVLGSAANMLPLPGSTLVRMQAMTSMGSTIRSAGAASLMTGLVWVGATVTLAGLGHMVVGGLLLGATVTTVGVALTTAGLLMLRRGGPAIFWSVAPTLIVVEVLFVLVAAMRLFLILRGLRIDVGASDVLALTVAAAVATAAGVFPAGLGLREVLTGVISPIVGIPAAAGVGAAVIDRIARMIMLAILAGVFVVNARGRQPPRRDSIASNDDGPQPEWQAPARLRRWS